MQYTFYSTINGYKNRTTTYYIATIERIGKLMEMGKLGLTISYDCKGIYVHFQLQGNLLRFCTNPLFTFKHFMVLLFY